MSVVTVKKSVKSRGNNDVMDITSEVTGAVASAEMDSGIATVFVTGSTAAITTVEFEPGLVKAVCPHHEVIQAELVYAMQEELSCTVSDILVRRTSIAFSSCQGLDMLSTIIDLFQRYCHLSREELETQIVEYRRLLAEAMSFRTEGQTLVGSDVS